MILSTVIAPWLATGPNASGRRSRQPSSWGIPGAILRPCYNFPVCASRGQNPAEQDGVSSMTAPAVTLPQRSKVPVADTWDATAVFADDAAWEAEVAAIA